MTAIIASLLEAAIKFLFFLFLAWGGIGCGKKYRDHKDAGNNGTVTKETK